MKGRWLVRLLTVAVTGLLLVAVGSHDTEPASASPTITVYRSPT